MNKIKIAILGCSGKTGSKILHHGLLDERIDIVGGLVSKTSKYLNDDLGKIVIHEKKIGIEATNEILDAIRDADIIIDFSTKDITRELIDNADRYLKGKKLIIGTTGFDNNFKTKLLEASKNHIIFQSSNMSLGIGLMCEFFKKYQKILKDEYEIVITDIHHKHKKDSPSGTALMLKHSFGDENDELVKNIQMTSARISDIKGIHEVIMVNECETITFKHDVSDRSIFAVNSLKIAHWLYNIEKNGLYHMNNFLNLSVN